MRAPHPSLGLYLRILDECTRGGARHNDQVAVGKGGAQEQLALGLPPVGSAGPRVGPLVPLFGQVLPQWSKTLKIWCTAKSLLEKMSKLFFPKDFKTQKIFLVFL